MTHALEIPAAATARRTSRWRVALAAVAVLATLPYVLLKVLWLTGSDVGLTDPDALSGGVMMAANAVTLLMELTAAGLAVLLVLEAGRRIPAAVVHVPMFVGTGLLGGILVALPVEALRQLWWTPPPVPTEDAAATPIESWVFPMVYGGFAVLGLSLLTIFALHSWDRWVRPGGWTSRFGTWPALPRRARRLAVGHAAVMVAVCATGGVVAARAGWFGSHDVAAILLSVVSGAALVALALRRPSSLTGSVALVLAYAGAAVVSAWGLYFFAVLSLPSPLRGDDPVPSGLALLELLRGLSGLVTAWVATRLRPAGLR